MHDWKALSYPEDVKKTALQLEMFDKDTFFKEPVFTLDCKSFNSRHKKAIYGNCYFSLVLHLDIFYSIKYLMPVCEIQLKLIWDTDDLVLLGATKIAKTKSSD
jgi:hypothetical protein